MTQSVFSGGVQALREAKSGLQIETRRDAEAQLPLCTSSAGTSASSLHNGGEGECSLGVDVEDKDLHVYSELPVLGVKHFSVQQDRLGLAHEAEAGQQSRALSGPGRWGRQWQAVTGKGVEIKDLGCGVRD